MPHHHLPRLDPENYQGNCAVHWSMTIEQRRRGWLDEIFHYRFRETLLHSLARYQAACPMYSLMPDHMHLLCIGMATSSDQLLMMRHFRRHLGEQLIERGFTLQKQGFDHVLRHDERASNPFEKIARYIAENPVRAGLIEDMSKYAFTGCVIPGYPEVRVFQEDYWDRFWRICRKSWDS
jgi:REP element-mobilizing transposase RayT